MEIKVGEKYINKGTNKSITDIVCSDKYKIFVFQGSLSKNDIIIKYSENKKRLRTPKHIHWTVDILMKLQGERKLTREFLVKIKQEWDNCKGLKNNDTITLSNVIHDGEKEIDIKSFEPLNKYGEYEMDFLFTLMKLLMVQEKTNREDAYMFGKIIEKLLEDEIDIFAIMSAAGFGGR